MPSTTDKFAFHLKGKRGAFETYRPAQRRVSSARSGKKFVLVRGDRLQYELEAKVAFPQPGNNESDLIDFIKFVDDHKALAFLVMPYTGDSMRRETTGYVATAGQTDFVFHHKHLEPSTLVVTKDGVPQSGATLIDNNDAPKGRIAACTGGETVVITALFYVPCVFLENPLEDGEGLGDDALLLNAPREYDIKIIETGPGDRFVDPSTAPTGV